MRSKAKPMILCVPPHMFADVWMRCRELVSDSLRTAGNMGDVVERVETGNLQFWLIADAKPLAVFFTDINEEEDGGRFVGVYGLAGRQTWRWAWLLGERMSAFAREERCARVLFKGRPAWGRLLPDFKAVRAEGREMIWERAA